MYFSPFVQRDEIFKSLKVSGTIVGLYDIIEILVRWTKTGTCRVKIR